MMSSTTIAAPLPWAARSEETKAPGQRKIFPAIARRMEAGTAWVGSVLDRALTVHGVMRVLQCQRIYANGTRRIQISFSDGTIEEGILHSSECYYDERRRRFVTHIHLLQAASDFEYPVACDARKVLRIRRAPSAPR